MDAVQVGHITNADVYLNDQICIGRFEEFNTPDFEYEDVKHAALGMVGTWKRAGRLVKELTGKGSTMYFDVDVQRMFLDPTVDIALTLDGYCDVFDGRGLVIEKGYRVINHVTISVIKTGSKAWKFGNDWRGEFEYTASRFVQKISTNQVPLREMDIPNQINRVNGRDVWPRY